jgi:hypothetical protein
MVDQAERKPSLDAENGVIAIQKKVLFERFFTSYSNTAIRSK